MKKQPTTSGDGTGGVDVGLGSENSAIDHAFQIVEQMTPPKARRGRRLVVCAAADLPPGQRRLIEDGSRSLGVFNVAGRFYAVKNVCPHMGAPLCRGTLHATHRPSEPGRFDPAYTGRILRCPWHGWEFDVVTGKGLYDRQGSVATYPVEVDENDDVVVWVH